MTPPSLTLVHTPTTEEATILAHLVLAGKNRSILSHDGPHHCTTLPQFTPTPIGGFPKVHMSHSAQICDHNDNKVLLAWFQVEHPKFMDAPPVQVSPPQPQGGRDSKGFRGLPSP
ncbi:hypothetical protein BDR03DRAFT_986788 [Suillus americanus]|nr:hypothetical protein BDR03DRAFT_986788 [Suillus americanus]